MNSNFCFNYQSKFDFVTRSCLKNCRLRKSKILIAGINGLGNEVCKNVILAGVQHMTILEDKVLTKSDCSTQFLAAHDCVGQNVSLFASLDFTSSCYSVLFASNWYVIFHA